MAVEAEGLVLVMVTVDDAGVDLLRYTLCAVGAGVLTIVVPIGDKIMCGRIHSNTRRSIALMVEMVIKV